ncbi:MAG: FtsX-like permease family protein, partial [Actinobacteria bacterium]|nr:FtsX-like permease family protein [Actinomycetota bacterium]
APREPGAALRLGSFNNAMKLTPRTIALWSRVLHALPGAELLLKAPSLKDAEVQARFAALFAAQGISADRLVFRGPSGLADMMQEYRDIDIALDPTPYNGGTTSLQALWMGVPVVALAGTNFVSRMGASFLHTLGRPDWVAEDDDRYVAAALNLARDIAGLRAGRPALRARMAASALCDVDAYVRSTTFIELDFGGEQRAGIPISALDTVRQVEGVVSAAGDIQQFARVIGKDGTPLGSDGGGPPTFGGIATFETAGLWQIDEGRLPVGATEMMLDRATADNGEFVVGDTVRVVAAKGARQFTLVGIASYGDISSPGGSTFALFDQPTASEFLLEPGFVDAFLIAGDGSVSDEVLADRIDAALADDLKLETLTGAEITAEVQGQIKDVLNIFSTFLIVFSYIALGIGSFVIYNVFSITAAQRQRENALLRAIGANRRQVSRAMLVEGTLMGVVGSLLGFAVGIALSQLLNALLKATGFEVPTTGLAIKPGSLVNTLIAGVSVTVLAAWLPARRAGRVPPLAALRDTALDTAGNLKRRVSIGLVLVALGAVAMVAASNDAPIQVLGLGVLGVFAGVLVLGPAIARPVALALGTPVAALRGVSGTMARQNAARNPKRTSRTAAPVLLGVALVTAFTALAVSIRSEIRDTFGDAFSGDFALTVDSQGSGGIPLSLTDQIAGLD